MKVNCILCDRAITKENDSKEHIIPNSIGGRLKVKGFICKNCNNKKGESWDAKLASQLNFFSLLCGVSREYGSSPSQQVRNILGEEDLLLRSDGSYTILKPEYKVNYDGDVPQISIKAANKKQLKEIAACVKKEFENLDFDTAISQAKITRDYSNNVIHTRIELIDDIQSGKSIIKSCLGLAGYYGINPNVFLQAINYLKIPDSKPCFGYFYKRDLIVNRPFDMIIHCVAITGNNKSGKVFGYVEYFGIHRIVAILSDNYQGENFNHIYTIEPISANKLEVEVNLDFSESEIEEIYENKQLSNDALNKVFGMIMPIVQARSNRKKIENAKEDALKYAWDNCGAKEGEILTEEHMRLMVSLCANKLYELLYKK